MKKTIKMFPSFKIVEEYVMDKNRTEGVELFEKQIQDLVNEGWVVNGGLQINPHHKWNDMKIYTITLSK